ncbi:MAG TPA: hypothetical protein ENJ18_09795 [Nannocystis exedens]|nr:hypothetical protein [Nannocystis exedens]
MWRPFLSAILPASAAMITMVGPAVTIAAPIELSTPPLPGGHGDSSPRAAGEPTTLFVNFDGAVLRSGCGNDAKRDCSTLADLFNGYVGPFTGNKTQVLSILQSVRKDLEDFGVTVVTQRPTDDREYTMILYGDLGEQVFAGVAPYVDCGDLWPSDTAFTNAYTSSNIGSTVILQEAAHTWGLEHVDAPFDTMNPFKTVTSQSFTDVCEKIVANTDLDETGGVCNQVHTLFCEVGEQNSWQEMRHLFGPSVPDTTAPTLEITSPDPDSTFIYPVSFPLRGIIDDDRHIQLYDLTIFRDDTIIFEPKDLELDVELRNPPPGEYNLMIRVADEAGNTTEESVHFTILPEGSVLPEDPEEEEEASGCRLGGPGPTGPAIWLLLPLLATRRRRFFLV